MEAPFQLPVFVDLAVLVIFLLFTPSIAAWWFLFLFVVFTLATQLRVATVRAFVILAALALAARVVLTHRITFHQVMLGAGVATGTLLSGFGMAFLASRQAQQYERHQFLEKISGLLHFDSWIDGVGTAGVGRDCAGVRLRASVPGDSETKSWNGCSCGRFSRTSANLEGRRRCRSRSRKRFWWTRSRFRTAGSSLTPQESLARADSAGIAEQDARCEA